MSEHDLSDFGDVLASRLSAIGIDPESETPLSLPSAESTTKTDADIIQSVINEDAAPEPAPAETVTQADTTATEESSIPPAHTAAVPRIMDYLRDKYGEDFASKYNSDEAALQGFINLNKKIGQRDEDAQLGRALKEQPEAIINELRRARPDLFPQPQAPQQPQAPAPQPVNDDGEFNLDWLRTLQVKDGTPPEVRQQIERWVQNRALATSPVGRELQATKQELAQIKQYLAQGGNQPQIPDVDAKLAAYQQQQAANEFVNSNASWLFTETNGVRVLSPEGFVYKNALAEASTGGASFDMARKYADNALAIHRSKAASKAPAKPAVTTTAAAARTPAPAVPQAEGSYEYFRDGEDLEAALTRNLKHFGLMGALGGG